MTKIYGATSLRETSNILYAYMTVYLSYRHRQFISLFNCTYLHGNLELYCRSKKKLEIIVLIIVRNGLSGGAYLNFFIRL